MAMISMYAARAMLDWASGDAVERNICLSETDEYREQHPEAAAVFSRIARERAEADAARERWDREQEELDRPIPWRVRLFMLVFRFYDWWMAR